MEVADAVEKGIRDVCPECDVIKVGVADGGEGTLDALCRSINGRKIVVAASDPLGRPVQAPYVVLDDGCTAVIEMAAASGLTLLGQQERNPLMTSTYGTGQLIADALVRGCRRFLVGIGGSATNDAGMGMLAALGFRFLDQDGKQLPGRGESLEKVASIDSSSLQAGLEDAEFIVACDVDSPFCGPDGAACVFAPQKGADPEMVERLDNGLAQFSDIIKVFTDTDVSALPGAGAAGGLGGSFVAFLGARLVPGADMILDAAGFDRLMENADLVITGEGRMDRQTLKGKLPYCVAKRAAIHDVPVVAICGQTDFQDLPDFQSVSQVTPPGTPLEQALDPQTASGNIRLAVRELLLKSL